MEEWTQLVLKAMTHMSAAGFPALIRCCQGFSVVGLFLGYWGGTKVANLPLSRPGIHPFIPEISTEPASSSEGRGVGSGEHWQAAGCITLLATVFGREHSIPDVG